MRWTDASSASSEMKMVNVIDTPPVGTVTLVAPSGLRIEGVSIDAAIEILLLRCNRTKNDPAARI
jgi:hypothetical protein